MKFIDYSLVGSKIKERRLKLGITQEQLAEHCNISVSYVAHIERGSRRLSLDTAVIISNVLDISLDYLLLDELNSENRMIQSLETQLSKCTPKQIERFLKISQVLISHIDEI